MSHPVEMTSWIGDNNADLRLLVTQRMIPVIQRSSVMLKDWTRIQFGGFSQQKEAENMLYWVRRHMLYTPDPPDIEHIKWPSVMLSEIGRLGHSVGDCDDYVMLYATLVRSREIPTRIVLTAREPVLDGAGEYQFDHIYTRVRVDWQNWITVDPSSEGAMGWETNPRYLTEDFDV